MLPSFLPSATGLTPRYRWRLVDTLWSDQKFMVQGLAALAGAAAVCGLRTGSIAFAALSSAAVMAIALRMALFQRFHRLAGAEVRKRQYSPDYWARQYGLNVLSTAALWGALSLTAGLQRDTELLLFVIVIECSWLSAAAIRNAAAPAAVLGQLILTMVPSAVALLLSRGDVPHLLLPFIVIQFSATLGLAAAVRRHLLRIMESEQRLEAANAKLQELSATDGLTGIGNRRAFDLALATEWQRAARDGTDLALLILDVDRFKAYNDRYGHPAGDDCLRQLATLLSRTLRRPPDLPARFGGEEFVALLPGNSGEGALEVAERLHALVADAAIPHEGSEFGRVTISIGVVSIAPQPGDLPEIMIALADQALYRAKQLGRNRTEITALAVPPAPCPVRREAGAT